MLAEPPAPNESTSIFRRAFIGPRGLRAGWRILLFHLIFIALSAGTFWGLQQLAGDLRSGAFTVRKLLLIEAIYLPATLVAVLVMARIERRSPADYGIRLRTLFGRNFWTGAGWGVAAVVAVALVVAAAGGMTVRGVTGGDLLTGAVLWALGALLIAVYEEIFFRGYSLSALADGIGFWPAAILQSLFFGFVLHYLEKDNETLLDGFNVSLIALFFCWTVLRSGDVAWATGIHFSFNFTSFFVLGSPNTAFGGPVDPHLLDSSFDGPQWLTGGATGLEASLITTTAFILLFLVVERGFRRRASGKLQEA